MTRINVRYGLYGLLALLVVALTTGSAYMFSTANGQDNPAIMAVGLLALAGLAMFIALQLSGNYDVEHKESWGQDTRSAALHVFWPAAILGIVCLLAVAEFSGNILNQHYADFVTDHGQFILLTVGCLLTAWGFSGWRFWRYRPHFSRNLWWLALLTLAGFVLRMWRLETAVHFFVDEINFASVAQATYIVDYVPLVAPFHGIAAFPWVYPYWQSLAIEVFGQTLTALRVVSVMFGTLSIPAMFFCANTLFNRRIAWTATILLTVFPPHIHFSRIGLNNIVDPLVGMLLIAFLVRGFKSRRQVDFALAGLMLGLTQYFYEGGRVLYPTAIVLWVLFVIFLRQAYVDRALVKRLLLTLLVGMIVALPVYYAIFALDKPLFQRYTTAGLGGSYYTRQIQSNAQQSLEEHLTWPLLMYVSMPERSVFYGGKTPIVLVYMVPVLLIGFLRALWGWRNPGYLLLLILIMGTSAGNMVMATSAHTARYVVAFPALILLATLGIYFTGAMAVNLVWLTLGLQPENAVKDRRPLFTLKINGALIFISLLVIIQVYYYYQVHLPYYNEQLRRELDIQDTIFRAADFDPGTEVCVITPQAIYTETYQSFKSYAAEHVNLCFIPANELNRERLIVLPRDVELAFFINRFDTTSLSILSQNIPGLQGPVYSPFDTVPEHRQYALYTAPALSPSPVTSQAGEG